MYIYAGEHVDYSGYGVLPMALDRQDTIMAVSVVDGGVEEDRIHLNNLSDRCACPSPVLE